MATTKFYLDARKTKKGESAPLTVSITKHGIAAYLPLHIKILPKQWDKTTGKIKDHPNKAALNSYIQAQKQKIDNLLLQFTVNEDLTKLSSVQIRNLIKDSLEPKTDNENLFLFRFKAYMNSRKKLRTKELYCETLKRINKYDPKADLLTFEQIGKDWLVKFDAFLSQYEPSQNSRSIHFRNIRAVFNDAISTNFCSCGSTG